MPREQLLDLPLHLSPAGRLRLGVVNDVGSSAFLDAVAEAFRAGEEGGLFELAARPSGGELSPLLGYWRDFTAHYLTERCHSPIGQAVLESLGPLAPEEAERLIEAAPPMEGAEYLGPECLQGLWASLDAWLLGETEAAGGLENFLAERSPLWRQVGRVCFHLAENKKDPEFPFAFLATYAPRLESAGKVRYQPLSRALQEFAGESNRRALLQLLTPISRAAERSSLVRELLDSGDIYQPLAWSPAEAHRFLKELPLFEESGVLVRVPDWWAGRPRPQVSVTIGSAAVGFLDANAILDFRIGVALGGESLDAEELEEIRAVGIGLALLKGRWVEVDAARLDEALKLWKKVEKEALAGGMSFAEGMRLLADPSGTLAPSNGGEFCEWSQVRAGAWLGDVLGKLRSPESIESSLPGPELKAELRPYQVLGLRWLGFLTRLGLGACLADDMGLGKTIQVIALLLLVKREAREPSLLVLPASLLANWKAELDRFAPSLRARFVHPSMDAEEKSDPEAAVAAQAPAWLSDYDLVVTTYGMLHRQAWISKFSWNLLVLDEAQAIKNPGSRQTKAAKRLKARSRIALTGTPIENRLSDLWSLFDFINPGLLGSGSSFGKFVKALEKRESERYAPLRRLVQPYILRRLKTDRSVIRDLPDKTEVTAYCGLCKTQAAHYRSLIDELAGNLREASGMKRRGLILSTLLKLKQVCNHPSQFTGDGAWKREQSGKFQRLAELCEEIASRQDRVLVFTQFREIAEPLSVFLAEVFGREGFLLHGGTPVAKRQELVRSFQDEDGPPFFVLSLKAGGTGLNLTAASHVIHFDRWWNPAVENQATDRVYRIGQKRNVLVHKFVCRGTVEEKIDSMLREKTSLSADLLEGGGEALLTELSDRELLETVSLDLGRALAEV
ncbi:MAG: DEAD/DEAH box helicase [Rectinemataceae bacterium]